MRYSKITKLAEPLVEEGVKKVAKFFKQEDGLLRLNKEAGLFTAVKADGITPIDTFMSDRAMFTQEAGLVPIKGIPAKHASPHKFESIERFDPTANKGKPVGEDSTDEGWGVYFSTNPGVHKFYLRNFGGPEYSPPALIYDRMRLKLGNAYSADDPRFEPLRDLINERMHQGDVDLPSLVKERMDEIDWSISQMTKRRADLVEATKEAERRYMAETDDALKQRAFNQMHEGHRQFINITNLIAEVSDEKAWLRSIPKDAKLEGGSSSYQAELLAKDDELLNWYEPLGDQIGQNPKLKKVWNAYEKLAGPSRTYSETEMELLGWGKGVTNPRQALLSKPAKFFYSTLSGHFASKSAKNSFDEKGERLASLWLDKNGIKGIKYEDSGSVALPPSQKTYNYVIFNPDNIKLKSRNKKALPYSPRETTSGLRQRYSGLGTITPIDQYLDEARSMAALRM